jgi:hypothetical protein
VRRYVIERDLPGAGDLTASQLQQIGQISNAAIRDVGPGIHWERSYVTADRIYCVYLADNETVLREHGKRGGFPCTRISAVVNVIDPLTEFVQSSWQ